MILLNIFLLKENLLPIIRCGIKNIRRELILQVGNEPFWTLEIDNEKFILLNLADWKKPVIVPVENL